MKKVLFAASLVLAGSIIACTVTGISADAEEFEGKSNTNVIFKKGTIVQPPVDPPEIPGETTDDFGLLYIPKEFYFTETTVPATPTDLVIDLDPTRGSDVPGKSNEATKRFAVGDVRGTYAGWKLEAKLIEMTVSGKPTLKLPGASITMAQKLQEITDPATNQVADPVSLTQQPDTVPATLEIKDTSTPIMSASAGVGQGYWVGALTDIKLKVPAAAAPVAGENYTGTVDWVLTDSI